MPDLPSDKDVASEKHFVWKTDAYLTRHQNNLMTEQCDANVILSDNLLGDCDASKAKHLKYVTLRKCYAKLQVVVANDRKSFPVRTKQDETTLTTYLT